MISIEQGRYEIEGPVVLLCAELDFIAARVLMGSVGHCASGDVLRGLLADTLECYDKGMTFEEFKAMRDKQMNTVIEEIDPLIRKMLDDRVDAIVNYDVNREVDLKQPGEERSEAAGIKKPGAKDIWGL